MSNTSNAGSAWVYLDEARAIEQTGDVATLRSMLPMLQELLERDVPEIARLLQAQDVRGANPLLHSLKGCMPIFCRTSLCEHLARVEHLSKAGSAAEVTPAFEDLRPQLDGLLAEVIHYQTL
ncbi:MAG: Hpt domain-containing protein [Rhodoferax sp.]